MPSSALTYIYIYMCVYIYLSICLSIYLSIYMFLFVYVFIYDCYCYYLWYLGGEGGFPIASLGMTSVWGCTCGSKGSIDCSSLDRHCWALHPPGSTTTLWFMSKRQLSGSARREKRISLSGVQAFATEHTIGCRYFQPRSGYLEF